VREIRVRATWVSDHVIEVPDDCPIITTLQEVLEYDDIDGNTASLEDWTIRDDGPGDAA
jgi:hypothetical protein